MISFINFMGFLCLLVLLNLGIFGNVFSYSTALLNRRKNFSFFLMSRTQFDKDIKILLSFFLPFVTAILFCVLWEYFVYLQKKLNYGRISEISICKWEKEDIESRRIVFLKIFWSIILAEQQFKIPLQFSSKRLY